MCKEGPAVPESSSDDNSVDYIPDVHEKDVDDQPEESTKVFGS